MTDSKTTPTPTLAPPVNLDAGDHYGLESYDLKRPFIYKGLGYSRLNIRVPCGADIDRCFRGGDYLKEMLALTESLTETPLDVFSVMYAGDRAEILGIVGKHIRGSII